MDRPVELIPLLCIRCGTPIPAQADEVAWVCGQCGQGQRLEESQQSPSGLAPLEVHYATGLSPHTPGRPFWVAQGAVSMQRQTYGSTRAGEAQGYWNEPRDFFIPAYTCPLEETLAAGLQYLARPPALEPGPPAPFRPVTLSGEDMQALAEFVVMAAEAARKDKLRELKFSLRLLSPALWILP